MAFLPIILLLVPASITAKDESERCEGGVEACVAEKREEWLLRGTVGMIIYPSEAEDGAIEGWSVHQVIEGGAAHAAGVVAGDMIVEWEGFDVRKEGAQFLDRQLEAIQINDEVRITALREGVERAFSLIAEKPSPRAVEYWLLFYVHENFSEEEYEAYRAEVQEKLRDRR